MPRIGELDLSSLDVCLGVGDRDLDIAVDIVETEEVEDSERRRFRATPSGSSLCLSLFLPLSLSISTFANCSSAMPFLLKLLASIDPIYARMVSLSEKILRSIVRQLRYKFWVEQLLSS